jgi:DNA ligase (NAD+)
MKVVFTGTLDFIGREEAKEFAKRKLGAAATPGSLSKAADLLVVGTGAGGKLEKAKGLGVRVMLEEEFRQVWEANK